jgi:hypothetical protein
MQTSDDLKHRFFHWEVPAGSWGTTWETLQEVPISNQSYSGCVGLVRWEGGRGELASISVAWKGNKAWGQPGIIVSRFGRFFGGIYLGGKFHQNAAVIVPNDPSDLASILALCQDPEFERLVRQVDQSPKVTNATLVKVPFDAERWSEAGAQRFADGTPEQWSADPAEWLFGGRLEASIEPLQVAVARLVGYRWPQEPPTYDLDGFTDADGIVCLPSVAGEAPAADRVQQLLAAAYGDRWSPPMVTELLTATGTTKKR